MIKGRVLNYKQGYKYKVISQIYVKFCKIYSLD